MVEHAHIAAQRHYDADGYVESTDYSWEGQSKIARFGWRLLAGAEITGELKWVKKSDIFRIGGLRLRVVKSELSSSDVLVMRDGRQAWAYEWLYARARLFRLIYARIILTAAIWKLATVEPGCIPTWRDLHWSPKSNHKINRISTY